jgi:predicted negative regulator of RcsB-dependent stress response
VTENEVDDYLSEREQVDRIRQWWKENGPWIIVGVGGGILALLSWNWWQGYKLERAEQASAIFSVLAEAAAEGRIEDIRLGVDQLAAGHDASPYLQHGRLALAAAMVNTGETGAAIEQLERVLADARDPQLVLVARVRLARLLTAEGEHERALGLVRGVDAGAFAPALLEVEGDVLAARGDADGARQAYRQALAGTEQFGAVIDEEFVRLKLEALEHGADPGSDAS